MDLLFTEVDSQARALWKSQCDKMNRNTFELFQGLLRGLDKMRLYLASDFERLWLMEHEDSGVWKNRYERSAGQLTRADDDDALSHVSSEEGFSPIRPMPTTPATAPIRPLANLNTAFDEESPSDTSNSIVLDIGFPVVASASSLSTRPSELFTEPPPRILLPKTVLPSPISIRAHSDAV